MYSYDRMAADKKVRLTPKEIARQDQGYTVVVRPQAGGGYMVAVVKIDGNEGELTGNKLWERYVKTSEGIQAEVKDLMRDLDIYTRNSPMGDASRDRWKKHTAGAAPAGVQDEVAAAIKATQEEVESLKAVVASIDNMRKVHRQSIPAWKALGAALEKADPQHEWQRANLGRIAQDGLNYGLRSMKLSIIEVAEFEEKLGETSKDFEFVVSNLEGVR